MFDEASQGYAKCGFPFSIDCTGREEVQPAQPGPGCPHQHGYFAHPDQDTCNKAAACILSCWLCRDLHRIAGSIAWRDT